MIPLILVLTLSQGQVRRTPNASVPPNGRVLRDRGQVRSAATGCSSTPVACTSGVTNNALRSEAFDNAAWTKSGGGGGAAPTVTANSHLAPDCTAVTAERFQIPATGVGEYSVALQSGAAMAYTGSLWVWGNGASGSIDLDCHNGAADSCTTCNFTNGSWTRCQCSQAVTGSGFLFIFGNYAIGCGGAATRAAVDIYAFGAQVETGASMTGYVPTTGTAATCP